MSELSAEGGHGAVPLKDVPTGQGVVPPETEWPLYEVFVRGKRGLNNVHVGSLHAADDRMALLHARELERSLDGVGHQVQAEQPHRRAQPAASGGRQQVEQGRDADQHERDEQRFGEEAEQRGVRDGRRVLHRPRRYQSARPGREPGPCQPRAG